MISIQYCFTFILLFTWSKSCKNHGNKEAAAANTHNMHQYSHLQLIRHHKMMIKWYVSGWCNCANHWHSLAVGCTCVGCEAANFPLSETQYTNLRPLSSIVIPMAHCYLNTLVAGLILDGELFWRAPEKMTTFMPELKFTSTKADLEAHPRTNGAETF